MKKWIAFQIFELKRFLKKRHRLLIVSVMIVLTLLFVQIGVGKLKKIHQEKPLFQGLEKIRVSMYISYRHFGTYGIRYNFIPDPLFVLFINSGVVDNVNAFVDAGDRLQIYNPLIGSNLFQVKKANYTDFSGIIVFFGSLLGALYGLDCFTRQKYLKFLGSLIKKSGHVYGYDVLSRLLILLGLLVIITGGAILVIILNGLSFSFNSYFLKFLLILFLVTLYFFFLGTVFSTSRSKSSGIATLLTCWFILLFIIPAALNYYIAKASELMTSIYQLEQEKLKLVMDFEKQAIEKKITYKFGEKLTPAVKNEVLMYFNNELKKINALEEKLRSQMRKYTELFQRLSLVLPITFYLSSCTEISSAGYQNIIEFYKYVQDGKKDFFKFYMDKVYFSENASNLVKVESFIKRDENVFLSQSRLPLLFGWGLAITSLHILILIFVSYTRYKKFIAASSPKSRYEKSPVDIDLEEGEFDVLECEDEIYLDSIHNRFAGIPEDKSQKGDPGTLKVNNREITGENSLYNSLYICHTDHLPPEVKTFDFIRLTGRLLEVPGSELKDMVRTYSLNSILDKKIKDLKKMEKGNLVLAIISMAKKQVYLVENAALNMPIEFAVRLKDKLEQKAKEGALALYLTSTDQVFDRRAEKGPGIYESTSWKQLVEHYKELYGIK